jgi:hypothetical protein
MSVLRRNTAKPLEQRPIVCRYKAQSAGIWRGVEVGILNLPAFMWKPAYRPYKRVRN